MKNEHKILFLLLAVISILTLGKINAQNPVEISVFNESTGVPFSGLSLKPLHPGVQIGTDVSWHESQHHKTYLSINLRYIFHRHLYRAIGINLELGYDYRTDFGMNLKTGIGVGYLHTFNVKEEYQFRKEAYAKKPDKGNSRFTPSVSFGFGYLFDRKAFDSTEIFAKQQYWLELPYSPGFIPLMSHANSILGIKFN